MTSATERLRALLDERGVEWWAEDGHTLWYGESINHAASAFSSFMFGENERVHLNAMVTPEQAVAAMLGPGTCRFEQIPEALFDDIECSECGVALWGFQMDIAGEGCPTKPRYCPNCGSRVVE